MHAFYKSIAVVLLLVLTAIGCDSADPAQEAPSAPPPEAFSLDNELFEATPVGKVDGGEYSNFLYAATRVLPVTAAVKAHLLVPAAVTAASLQSDPVLEDGAWQWASTTLVGEEPASFTLRATTLNSTVAYSMYVSMTHPRSGATLDDFELYHLELNPGTQAGSWRLYYPVEGTRQHVLSADFEVEDARREIVFSVPTSMEEHGGDQVLYAEDDGLKVFRWTDADHAVEHHVTWDPATRQGSVTADGFNGGETACWNAALRNVTCGGL